MMYYTYAMQLDRENKAEHLKPTDNVVSEIALSYSKNIDKLKLTDKDVNEVVNINVWSINNNESHEERYIFYFQFECQETYTKVIGTSSIIIDFINIF